MVSKCRINSFQTDSSTNCPNNERSQIADDFSEVHVGEEGGGRYNIILGRVLACVEIERGKTDRESRGEGESGQLGVACFFSCSPGVDRNQRFSRAK